MAYTLTDKYSIPSCIQWFRSEVQNFSRGASGTEPVLAPLSGTTYLYITFYTDPGVKTCECEWQVKGRMRPYSQSSSERDWDKWVDLTSTYPNVDANTTYDSTTGWIHSTENRSTESDMLGYNSLTDSTRYLKHAFPFSNALFTSGAWSSYDLIRFTFRVRVQDEPTQKCSEWQYQELDMSFVPSLTDAQVYQSESGKKISVQSNWERGFTLRVKSVLDENDNVIETLNPNPVLSFDFIGTIGSLFNYECMWPYDGIYTFYDTNKYYSSIRIAEYSDTSGSLSFVPGKLKMLYNYSVGTYTTTLTRIADDSDIKATLTLGSGYSIYRLSVNAYYEDVTRGTITLDTQCDTTGSITVFHPPYDTNIYVECTVITTNNKIKVFTETMRLDSNNMSTLTYGSKVLKIRFDFEPDESFSNECDSAKIAGADSPKSRYGVGGTRSIRASGNLLNPNNSSILFPVGDKGMWRSGLSELEAKHDWIYRAPGGVIRNVMVKSYSAKESKGLIDVAIAIDIDMIEVM